MMKIYSNTVVVVFCIFFVGGGISLPLNFQLPPRLEKNLMTLPTSSPPLTNSTNNSIKMPIVEDKSTFWEDLRCQNTFLFVLIFIKIPFFPQSNTPKQCQPKRSLVTFKYV